MGSVEKKILSGNEAVAHAAIAAQVHLGAGYPGTPSTEILETFSALGGRAQWAPNEKVAFEVALGVAYGCGRALVTSKHVGVNVAADALFSAAYTGISGALVFVVADDPGMASSQNEQDTRRYAVAAGVPLLEPADAQEAYDFFLRAVEISEQWGTVVILRLTTRVSHTKSVVGLAGRLPLRQQPRFERNIRHRVLIPANARPAHRRLRERLARLAEWNETSDLNAVVPGTCGLGVITTGVASLHVREAVPQAGVLKLGMVYPLPARLVTQFVERHSRCLVIEEGDPVIFEQCVAHGVRVEPMPEMFRFGELNVARVRRLVAGEPDVTPPPTGVRPPQFCQGCPHRMVFEVLRELDCIVAGDIGCYSLGALPPYESLDTCVCMGAAIGVGLGWRHVLPPEQARRVVSVIGDSTFIHAGLPGVVEMVYNPPSAGHVVIILDNDTTAMTGGQEHPGTGRRLDGSPTHRLDLESVCRGLGVEDVVVFESRPDRKEAFRELVRSKLDQTATSVIIVRRPCVLVARRRHAAARAACTAAGQTAS